MAKEKRYPLCEGCARYHINTKGAVLAKQNETCSKCNGNWSAGQRLTLKRMECNELILKQLTEYIHNNPDLRFSQALLNLGITTCLVTPCKEHMESHVYWHSDYYLEPEELIKRMSKG